MKSIVERIKPLQHKQNMQRVVLDYFSALEFSPGDHTYKANKNKLTSVSVTLKQFSEPFDADRIAGYVAKKRSKLEGRYVSKAEILAEWEDKKNRACAQGTNVHTFGENYKKGNNPTNGFENAIINFWDSIPNHIEPFLLELQMYSNELKIAGTADIILYNTETNKFILADYKTNENIFKNYKGKKLLYPFNNLVDCAYNKYQLQLSLYQILFEQCGFEVESRRIIWLKPDGSYESFKTQDYTQLLLNTLKQ